MVSFLRPIEYLLLILGCFCCFPGFGNSRYIYLGNLTEPITPYINITKGDLFGSTISISKDGNTMIIGASYVNNGKGYAYWYTSNKLNNPPEWIFQSNLTFPTITNCYYGGASALSHNGLRAIIGSPCWTGQAAVSFWERNNSFSPWRYLSTFSPPGWSSGDRFGSAIACNSDCSTVVFGVPFRTVNTGSSLSNAGVAYVCTLSSTVNYWSPTNCTFIANPRPSLGMYFGTSVGISSSGTTFVIGSDSYGAWVYERDTATGGWISTSLPSTICDPNYPSASGNYGEAVTISGDGTAILVGGPVGGSVGAAIGRTLSHNRLPVPESPGQYVWNCTQSIIGPSSCQGAYSCDSFLFGSLVRLDNDGLNAWITSANLAGYYYNRSRINETWKYVQPMRFPSPGSLQNTGASGDIDGAMSMPVIGAKGNYFSTIVEGYAFTFYDPDRLAPSSSPTPTSTSSATSSSTASSSATSTTTSSSTATSSSTSSSTASGSASATNTATSTQGSSPSNSPSNTPSNSYSNTPSPSTTSTATTNSTGPDNNNNNNNSPLPESILGNGGMIGIVLAGIGILGLGSIGYIVKFNPSVRIGLQNILQGNSYNGGKGYGGGYNSSNGSSKKPIRRSSGQARRQPSLGNPRPGSTRILLTSPFPTSSSFTPQPNAFSSEGTTTSYTKITFNPTAVANSTGTNGTLTNSILNSSSSNSGGLIVRSNTLLTSNMMGGSTV